MKRLILALYLASVGAVALAQVSIPSGSTAHYVPFIAVDSTDKVTRETGLSSFTVYRKRENGTLTAMTTPTVVEDSSSNAPGVYRLLLDEDTTIGAGNDTEVMTLHITHAGMEPVTMTVNLYRPKLTAGQTLTISGGSANAAVQSVASNAINAAAIADGAIDLATFATDANPLFGILRRGTAQSATSTTLVLDSGASFGDDTPIGATLVACGSTQGYCQSRLVTDYTSSSDTATVSTWPVTPSGTITYYLFASAPSEGGSGGGGDLTAEDVWEYEARTLTAGTNLPTAAGIADAVWDEATSGHTTAGTFGERVTRIPNAAAGGNGGLPTLDSNSRVSSNVTAMANDVITAAATASDFGAEVRTGLATSTALTTAQSDLTTLLGRLTTTRAGYMDKLNITGNVAAAGDLQTVDDVVDALQVILDKLDDTLEDNSGTYRFTESALAQAPAGEGGGGGTDWDADERTAIRAILGVPVSGSTPADPSSGILDTIRDAVATRASQTSVDDLPTNAELTSALASADDAVLAAIGGLNDLSSSEVEDAAASALADYDPPTLSELTANLADLLNTLPPALRDLVVEDQGSVTLGCALSVALSYAAGDVTTTGQSSTYRDPSGAETRIAGTLSSNGNRAVSITCPTY